MPVLNPAQDHATVLPSPRAVTMRKFGIELELVAPNGRDPLQFAIETVRSTGIAMRSNTHYGRDYTHWQAKPDGSIQPYNRGAEVVSRIMPASTASYDEITRVVNALDAAGFGVNRSCGFHVHVNVSDLPMHVRQLIVLRYAALQAEIDAMVPPSRRGNNYAQPMNRASQNELASEIDRGGSTFHIGGRYSVTNTAWAAANDGTARIEFRQAAATCNAAKVVGWVRFLQEMIDEVATRAAGQHFGMAFATRVAPAPRPVLTPAQIGGRVPTMRRGSDADRAMEQLCQTGAVSTQWARDNGIAEAVLRRIIVGWRRHAAAIITQRTDNGPVYILAGTHALPVARSTVFSPAATRAPLLQPAPQPAPIVQPAVIRAADFVGFPFNDGLSAVTVAWCRDRRDTFAASDEAAPR